MVVPRGTSVPLRCGWGGNGDILQAGLPYKLLGQHPGHRVGSLLELGRGKGKEMLPLTLSET